MNKRLTALFLALTMLAALLTGCADPIGLTATAEEPQMEAPPAKTGESAPARGDTAPAAEPEETGEPEGGEEAPEETEDAFFTDVAEGKWYYPYIHTLYTQRVLPRAEVFRPDAPCSRMDLVRYLYGLHLATGGKAVEYPEPAFPDVTPGTAGYEAVMWASESGVTDGMEDGAFRPGGNVTREQCCTFLMRYAALKHLNLPRLSDEPAMFKDSLSVRTFARSYVAACQLAGIVDGYASGRFIPAGNVTHAEAAKMVCVLSEAAEKPSGTPVSTAADAYLKYYDNLPPLYQYGDPVPESTPVDLSWFDSAVIVGDSVTLALSLYCNSTRALGNATFLASGSLSAINNNNMSVTNPSSVHPTYKGVKMKIEDGVAASGRKNVYIMLGMNNFYVSLEHACNDMLELVNNIKAKSPGVNIIIESVTPTANGATVASQGLTNDKINRYNAMMQSLCKEQGWYYLDVASQFKDEGGFLRREYCGDYPNMGIHFTYAATKIWCDYLISHVPEDLK